MIESDLRDPIAAGEAKADLRLEPLLVCLRELELKLAVRHAPRHSRTPVVARAEPEFILAPELWRPRGASRPPLIEPGWPANRRKDACWRRLDREVVEDIRQGTSAEGRSFLRWLGSAGTHLNRNRSSQLIVQRYRMFGAVPYGRRAIAAQAKELSRSRARDD